MHNLNIFECYPLEFWQKQLFVKSMTDQIPLSNTHTAIKDIYNGLTSIGRNVFVVTQNAEGLERKALENTDAEIYEIHGNLNQMRCCAGCTQDLYPTPEAVDQLDFIPLCYTCGGLARPNILLNDECYDEELYKAETAFRATESADCIIILGSSLEQSLPSTIVKAAAKRGALVVEIGETCLLEYGNTLQVKEKPIEAFPMLAEVLGQVLFR